MVQVRRIELTNQQKGNTTIKHFKKNMNRRTLIWVIIPQGCFSPSTTTAAWYKLYQRCKTWGQGRLMVTSEDGATKHLELQHGF